MKKIYALISFLIISLNISANLTDDNKPKFINRHSYIKFCLEQNNCDFNNKNSSNYVSRETILLLTKLSYNKTCREINKDIYSAITTKKNKYKQIIEKSLSYLQNRSLLEESLITKFSNKNFDYTNLLIASNMITLGALAYTKFSLNKEIKKSYFIYKEYLRVYEAFKRSIK